MDVFFIQFEIIYLYFFSSLFLFLIKYIFYTVFVFFFYDLVILMRSVVVSYDICLVFLWYVVYLCEDIFDYSINNNNLNQ